MTANMKQSRLSACRCSRASLRRAVRVSAQKQAVAVTVAPVVVKEHGAFTVKGTVRKVNEDRFAVQVRPKTCSSKNANIKTLLQNKIASALLLLLLPMADALNNFSSLH